MQRPIRYPFLLVVLRDSWSNKTHNPCSFFDEFDNRCLMHERAVQDHHLLSSVLTQRLLLLQWRVGGLCE
jgi:hypothetical protein